MKLACIVLLALLLGSNIIASAGATSPQAVSQALGAAEAESQLAYKALREAQLAGANVTNISGEFNQAIGYLQTAYSYNATGSFDLALAQAQEAVQTFVDIRQKALQLESDATMQSNLHGALFIITAIASVSIITLGFHFFEEWRHRRWLKRFSEKRIRLRGNENEAD